MTYRQKTKQKDEQDWNDYFLKEYLHKFTSDKVSLLLHHWQTVKVQPIFLGFIV